MSLADLDRAVLTAVSPPGRAARLSVLIFHQVLPDRDPLAPDEPSAVDFEQRIAWLAEFCNVLPLREAARRLQQGSLPARAAVITFDDGYGNNLEIAAPILRRAGLPATIFVAADAVDRGIMWNDLVIEGVRRARGVLDLTALSLGSYAIEGMASRHLAIRKLLPELKYRPWRERLRLSEAVFSAATSEPPPRLMMSRKQVKELAEQGFEIGGHTVNHPILKGMTDAEARDEIENGTEWIREVTGSRPLSFAYPNGRPGTDYADRHANLVRDAGFEVAVSTRWACATVHDPVYELPRFAPWERDRRGFWLRLAKTCGRSWLPG